MEIFHFFFGGYNGYNSESIFFLELNRLFFDFYSISPNFELGNIKLLYDYYKNLEHSLKREESKELLQFFIFYFDVEFAIVNIKKVEANIFLSNKEIIETLLPSIITFIKYENFDFVLEYIIYFCQKLRKNLFIQILFPILEELIKSNQKKYKNIELKHKYEEYAKERFVKHFEGLDLSKDSSEREYLQNIFDVYLKIILGDDYLKGFSLLDKMEKIDRLNELIEYYNKNQNNLPHIKELVKLFFYVQYIGQYEERINSLLESIEINQKYKELLMISTKKNEIKLSMLYLKNGDKGEEELSSFNLFEEQDVFKKDTIKISIFKNLFTQKQIVLIEIKNLIDYDISHVTLEEFKDTINNNLKIALKQQPDYANFEVYCFFNYSVLNRCLTIEKAFSLFPDLNKSLNDGKYSHEEDLLRIISEEPNDEENNDNE